VLPSHQKEVPYYPCCILSTFFYFFYPKIFGGDFARNPSHAFIIREPLNESIQKNKSSFEGSEEGTTPPWLGTGVTPPIVVLAVAVKVWDVEEFHRVSQRKRPSLSA
jgi:hypothetical protein